MARDAAISLQLSSLLPALGPEGKRWKVAFSPTPRKHHPIPSWTDPSCPWPYCVFSGELRAFFQNSIGRSGKTESTCRAFGS